jgi:hypothetical protein
MILDTGLLKKKLKVKKSSWHYRLLKWADMEPSNYRLTSRYYRFSVVIGILYFISGGFFIEGLRHIALRFKTEPVEFIEEDDKDNNDKINN